MLSCHDRKANTNANLSLADYETLSTSAYKLNSHRIREEIDSLCRSDNDSAFADIHTRKLYYAKVPFVWIGRKGIDHRTDSLLNCLRHIEQMGFSDKKFRLAQISQDMERLRTLHFDADDNRINKVAARLEYNLTKAYLRYAVGQGFGFMNPKRVFNRLDVYDSNTAVKSYRTLFDLKIPQPDKHFVDRALRQVQVDSISHFLHEMSPKSTLYHRLLKALNSPEAATLGRTRILVNMERCRWRLPDYPRYHEKYVLVNIPSFHLRAVDHDRTLSMRIAFGAYDTKTPLMISQVKRMDLNPQWIMPMSIVKKSILPRLGNEYYFTQHQYFIRDRQTGQIVSPRLMTRDMLLSGKYMVVQRGGEGNALGRIIFRFDNNLSIYLHDTSSRGVFTQLNRDVSHGCVRVEHPFDLAMFMLDKKDDRLISRIRYSMNADVSPVGIPEEEMTGQMQAVSDTLDRKRLIGHVEVKPRIPIFIVYYTLYPDDNGAIEAFSDVYGYDAVMYRELRQFI